MGVHVSIKCICIVDKYCRKRNANMVKIARFTTTFLNISLISIDYETFLIMLKYLLRNNKNKVLINEHNVLNIICNIINAILLHKPIHMNKQ